MPAPYISELRYAGSASSDFVEIAVDSGASVANISVVIYHANGSVRSTNALGTPTGTVWSSDIYVIDTVTSSTFNGLHRLGAVALVDNGTVIQFVSFGQTTSPTTGPAAGMTSTQLPTTASGNSLETFDNGVTYSEQSTPNAGTIPCFVAGTMIDTLQGARDVQFLRAGDLVQTADNGAQPVLWAGRYKLRGADAAELAPVVIPAGWMGAGAPYQDLALSPNHCVLSQGPRTALLFGADEVLIPAKHLNRRANAMGVWTYHHLLFACHEIIFANGLAVESLFAAGAYESGIFQEDAPIVRHACTARPVLRGFEAMAFGKVA